MNKWKAFTLVEMMVVLLLSSLLLTAASAIYLNVLDYHHRLRKRIDHTNAYYRLKYYLERDTQRSASYELKGDELQLGKETHYQFGADTVFREWKGNRDFFLIGGQCQEQAGSLQVNFTLYQQSITLPLKSKSSYRQIWKSKNK
ncbi:prepilin-type N-terminal cleavage/methylation domain-containing protein [Reichenbachiella ulvae]|uniref:Prepilin-type N-terminal cleavage/methylation domain-containing protein n=1 Tax=Reichenbachiella ulvae TaxID=2980104 RepID=A0ABT3CVA7_9BACT|nr:prepilin-type N-terminal cleavage/methylation domain-containing protein [Reichenbachiella ulvae]MCV9387459.1 prepilin-type N-terminal cleavage/methylation domain-containing protein [Reichenbachiella ulvae]